MKVLTACLLAGVSLLARAATIPTGFVKAYNQKFMLGSAEYTLVGSNSYWVGLTGLNSTEMNQAFADIAATGATTVRTWGFNEVTAPINYGAYYQLWTNGTAAVNYGANGLQNFDMVVAAAKANGLRLIVTLTNNWSDYGGMDVYVSQILGAAGYHDDFYTNPTVIAAYKNYINAFVSRYEAEPGILAWELCNEPRCTGSPGTQSGACSTANLTITTWAREISAYIKSIDSNHLVGLGDEGWFNEPSSPYYPYQGGEGIDFNANLAIYTLDYGTLHLYPFSWGQTTDPIGFGNMWITDHATSQKNYNKPVIVEEFGVTNTQNQTTTYTSWYSTILSSGMTGDLIWQAGSYLPSGPTPNDGYTIYPNETTLYEMETQHAAAIKARG